jgi:hypothetical protein
MTAGTNTRKSANEGRRQRNAWSSHRAPAAGRSQRQAAIQESPDFSLIREVQMRATGANIHALAQQMQIYVSAIECGAMLHARAAESHLRAFLASGR